jgi:hypothetical protein
MASGSPWVVGEHGVATSGNAHALSPLKEARQERHAPRLVRYRERPACLIWFSWSIDLASAKVNGMFHRYFSEVLGRRLRALYIE